MWAAYAHIILLIDLEFHGLPSSTATHDHNHRDEYKGFLCQLPTTQIKSNIVLILTGKLSWNHFFLMILFGD